MAEAKRGGQDPAGTVDGVTGGAAARSSRVNLIVVRVMIIAISMIAAHTSNARENPICAKCPAAALSCESVLRHASKLMRLVE